MIHQTKGLVLRTIKYGETSIVVSIFTELFGLQSYLVNGVRTASRKGMNKAGFFQPGALLDLVAYQNEFKNLQRLKEYKWSVIYQHLYSDVRKNAVALFMVELMIKCLKQPEPNPDLFYFVEDAFTHLDKASERSAANFPLFFALHLPVFFGFRITDNHSTANEYLDLAEGSYTTDQPAHSHYLHGPEAMAISQILKVMHPSELEDILMNQDTRRRLTLAIENYYALHLQDFGTLKTLPVLRELMS